MLPLSSTNEVEQSPPRGRSLTWGVRIALVAVLAGVAAVFAVAVWLDPYYAAENGVREPRLMGTHRGLGLPPCSFVLLTKSPSHPEGLPCPSCGMTTSFSLLAHGDVKNSLRANWVGTLLALCSVAFIPWGVTSLVRGRLLGVRSLERTLTWAVAIFLTLLLVRWGIVLARGWPPS